ncbi:MAG: AraC family transcriptional regulator [Prevotella sp.]|nr:AraC family transcriptional regulator [Prevotella sp.]
MALLVASLLCMAGERLPDSLLTIANAYRYTIVSPDTSLAIVHAMRNRHLLPDWHTDLIEGDIYYQNNRFRRARPFYERAYADRHLKDSTHLQLMLLRRLTDCAYNLYDDSRFAEYVYLLKHKGKGYPHYEAVANFMIGRQQHFHGHKAEGYQMCTDALSTLSLSNRRSRIRLTRRFYAELVIMYMGDRRYDDALRTSHLHEQWCRQSSGLTNVGVDDRDLRRVYALRASLLAAMGRMTEADEAYRHWHELGFGNAVDDREMLDYLMLSHHDSEALQVAVAYRDFIAQQGDSVSYRMLSILNREARILAALGQYQQATIQAEKMGAIADSLRQRVSQRQVQTSYDLLAEQEASHRKTLLVYLITAVALGLLVLAQIVLYYTVVIRRRNRTMVKVLNSLAAYRSVFKDSRLPMAPEVAEALEQVSRYSSNSDMTPEEGETPDDEDRRLFVEMDMRVTNERLFLKPGFGRDELMRLIGVDKNRFGKMMSKYSDASNASVYVSTKRVEYGAQLLVQHPEYTIATIATECGMSNTVTFNRVFREVYGITPSEYRQRMSSGGGGRN